MMLAAPTLLGLVLAAPPCALPALGGALPFTTGETVVYDLDVLGIVKAGMLQLSVERPISGGKVLSLRARGKTDASLANLRKATGVGLSWVDARTLVPERYREESEEDGVRRSTDARLRPSAPSVRIEERVGERRWAAAYPRDGDVLDAVSAAYYLRAARLAPGAPFCFDLVARGRYWRVRGAVAGKTERVDTPVGKLETIRLDAEARRAGAPADAPGRPVHLWISTDARRLLVAVVSEIDAGPVRAMLASVRGARRP
jgi:hypothetical protein